jgi:ATP-dependent RNA helicase RhlE
MLFQVVAASHPVIAPADSGPSSGSQNFSPENFICLKPVSKEKLLRGPIPQETVISTSFESLGLLPELLRAVAEQGYTEPTPIQVQAIPVVASGRDLLAAAQTGTGKTAGFVLPVLQRLAPMATKSFSPALHPVRCLILTPTRELAIQVHESVQGYGKHLPLRSFCVYGGVNINPQIDALKKGVEILVATPGRLLDLVQQKAVNLRTVQILILDEADRMLDMGFIPDIKRIIALLPQAPTRQTLLFSATFSEEIRKLSAQFLKDPASVEVARRNTPAELVTQYVYHVDSTRKRELLAHLVKTNNWEQVLVFCKTKHGSNRLAQQLVRDGINADAIHGNKSQNARVRALEDFKEGKVKVLVATDIAARGIDIEELPHVVNYDLPHVPEDYVHRIGRTGRAGSSGEAFSLIGAEDRPLLGPIERLINRKIDVRTVEGFDAGRRSTETPEEDRERPRQGRGRSQGQGRTSQGHGRGNGRSESSQGGAEASRSRSEPSQGRASSGASTGQGRGDSQGRASSGQGRGDSPVRTPSGQARTEGGQGRSGAQGRGGQGSGQARNGQGSGQGRGNGDSRRGSKRDDGAPRYAGSPAARSSGNSGGMDFSKPYEPSTPAAAAAEPAGETAPRRKAPTAVPALFKRKTEA